MRTGVFNAYFYNFKYNNGYFRLIKIFKCCTIKYNYKKGVYVFKRIHTEKYVPKKIK